MTIQLFLLKSYLRRHVEKPDPLDMDAYEEWIVKMYHDWLLQQLYTHGQITLEKVNEMRTDERTVTYTKRRKDSSTVLVTQKVDNEQFLELLKDATVQIIF